MKFSCIAARLEALEALLFSEKSPWPPASGSLSFWLWDAIGRPGERRAYLDMYLASATKFWEWQK